MTVDDVAWNGSRWSELAPGVHERSFASWNLNVGVVVGEEKALVVDTRSTPREGRELLAHVRELTDLELLVVNTHAHPDHCRGNEAFAGSRVLAHPVALEAMRSGRFARRPAPVAHRPSPVASAQDQVSTSRLLDLGGRRVAVHFHG
ncbi:MAG TPA: MBL fold metallo-hydrolase, partial [Marmoricola sp.]|nr:MBL fold metallo-hydrolase [Marmoricola sp.]